ncbi:MAG: polyphosphate polymerase domain-containing protein [Firmicutes bacterium]|nr:polyphosphate polymerase domain-containing protein [Bacillota bacterium]
MRKYRNEIKFVINKDSAEILKRKLSLLMDIDSNSSLQDNSYLIRSLYFDNINSDAYYEKIDGVEYRKKYRIRLYNNDCSFIRLECKYKHENMTSKDQILIDKSICDRIINGNIEDLDISGNNLLTKFVIDYRLKNLRPSIIVDYKRLAYTYPISDVRVTFDSKIRSGMYNYNLYDEELETYKVIDDNQVVLEVKFNEILPESIAIVLSTVPMIRQAFSKFATCRSIK